MNIARAGIGFFAAAALMLAGMVAIQGTAVAQPEGPPPTETPAASGAARKPELIALEMYADWCMTCKRMMPAAMQMREETANMPVLFVRLDKTDRDSPQAEFLTAALGYGELWPEHAAKTGYILLVKPESKRIAGRLTADMDAAAMTQAVENALKVPDERPKSEHPEHPRRRDHPDHPRR